jgi:DNA polymerase-3 subunit alpha (Gram-positive type)
MRKKQNLDEVEFTIFDTETTGLEPESGDRIVEIAGIRVKDKERIATFQSLVNPHRPISSAAFEVNNITPQMLEGAPSIEIVMPKFLKFIQGSFFLCSYNAPFDLGFLNNELKLMPNVVTPGVNLRHPEETLETSTAFGMGRGPLENLVIIDILKMAKRLLPGLERYALWFVAERLGVKNRQLHRALSDVELALGVFNKLREILQTKDIFDVVNFSSLFGINSQLLADMNNQKIAKIQEAIELGVKLKIRYLSSSFAEVSERDVVPREIRQERNHGYLIGYCCLRNEERTFRIDGILHLEIV